MWKRIWMVILRAFRLVSRLRLATNRRSKSRAPPACVRNPALLPTLWIQHPTKCANSACLTRTDRFDSKSYCLKYKFFMSDLAPKLEDLTPQVHEDQYLIALRGVRGAVVV